MLFGYDNDDNDVANNPMTRATTVMVNILRHH